MTKQITPIGDRNVASAREIEALGLPADIQSQLESLPEEKRQALLDKYLEKGLDLEARRVGIQMDGIELGQTLDKTGDAVKQAADEGLHITTTAVFEGDKTRVETIVGNTETAGKGKLSRSQTGEKDWTPYYVFGALAAVVLIAFAMAG